LWPYGHKAALCLSHDIDVVQKTAPFFLLQIFRALEQGNIKVIREIIKQILEIKKRKINPYWSFEKIVSLEKKYRASSTFFLLGVRSFPPLLGSDYKFDELRIKNLVRRLQEEGCDIGVHGSFHSFDNLELLKNEKEEFQTSFKFSPHGIRQHFLNYDMTKTSLYHDLAGYLYDSTVGYNEVTGFRLSCCLPVHPFCLSENKKLRIYELPLIIMDRTLFDKKFMNLSYIEAKNY
jgi:peptidoglycan/xylan/chitin deacetylase (PgdA/CDA1 family)